MPSESDKWGWQHVSVFGGFEKGSGTKRWKCNYCNMRYNGSYSRVRAHLLGLTGAGVKSCPAIDKSLRKAFQILEEDRLASRKKKTARAEKFAKYGKNSSQRCLPSSIRNPTKEDVDEAVARFFFANGIYVKVIDSPYFQDMAKALAVFGPGYEPPSADKLSESLFRKEKARLEKVITLVKESWVHTSCTILSVNRSDGSLGFFCIDLYVSCPRGVMFLKAMEVNLGPGADDLFIGVICDTISDVGPMNVLQVVAHLGQFSGAFESKLVSKFPRVFWSHCTTNSIYLLMEEIAQLDWMKGVVLCARGIEQCILTYQESSSVVIMENPQIFSDSLSLKVAPSYALVKRIFDIKQGLNDLVTSDEWKRWKLTFSADVSDIEAAICGDDFWSRVNLMLLLLEPFVGSLATFNIDKSVIGDAYNWCFQSLEAVRTKGIDKDTVNQLKLLIENKWNDLFSPLQAAGYILNPKYFGRGQTKDRTAMQGWKAVIERYEAESSVRRLLREQLSAYWRLEGSLGEADAVESRDKMDPVAWWENFGFETPHLQALAIKVLSQVSSVTVCLESFLCNNMRSNEPAKSLCVEDLAFVQQNLRLQTLKFGNSRGINASKNSKLCDTSTVGSKDTLQLDDHALH